MKGRVKALLLQPLLPYLRRLLRLMLSVRPPPFNLLEMFDALHLPLLRPCRSSLLFNLFKLFHALPLLHLPLLQRCRSSPLFNLFKLFHTFPSLRRQ